MEETPRIPLPAGEGGNFSRFGKDHPELLQAAVALQTALLRVKALDPVTQEAVRLRTARYHRCGR